MSRSLKKGPFCDDHLLKKVNALNDKNAFNFIILSNRSKCCY